jgi:uncharacterized protein YprB with RNaseH-like and TPR domain
MRCPVHKMKVDEIRKAAAFTCVHGHSGLEHYDCYLREHPEIGQRIGFLDIETSNLDANFGIMLSYCIKEQASDTIFTGVLNEGDIAYYPADKSDTRIVEKLVEDMLCFDKIVTFYGKRFDVPFIRTRAIIDGVDFPYFGSIKHDDVYFWAKFKLKLNSNRLEVVARTLFGSTEKNHIDYAKWVGGVRGDKESLEYILDHNKRDVIELERVYDVLVNYARRQDSSI